MPKTRTRVNPAHIQTPPLFSLERDLLVPDPIALQIVHERVVRSLRMMPQVREKGVHASMAPPDKLALTILTTGKVFGALRRATIDQAGKTPEAIVHEVRSALPYANDIRDGHIGAILWRGKHDGGIDQRLDMTLADTWPDEEHRQAVTALCENVGSEMLKRDEVDIGMLFARWHMGTTLRNGYQRVLLGALPVGTHVYLGPLTARPLTPTSDPFVHVRPT